MAGEVRENGFLSKAMKCLNLSINFQFAMDQDTSWLINLIFDQILD